MSPDPKDARSSDHEPAKSLDSEEEFLISEDLVPSTPKRQSQTVALDFNGLLNPPLLIQTNETQCGGQLWPGGMVLAEYLLQNEMGQLAGKTMVELGAGSGVVSLALASGLRHTGISNNIHITDGLSTLIPLITNNITLNRPSILPTTLLVPLQFSWGSPLPNTLPLEPDIVLAADCCYLEESFPLLLKTLADLIGEETVCWFCYKKRRRADRDMIRMLAKVFEMVEIEGKWQRERIFLYQIKAK